MGCFVSCRISTDKRVARSLCHSRATCFPKYGSALRVHDLSGSIFRFLKWRCHGNQFCVVRSTSMCAVTASISSITPEVIELICEHFEWYDKSWCFQLNISEYTAMDWSLENFQTCWCDTLSAIISVILILLHLKGRCYGVQLMLRESNKYWLILPAFFAPVFQNKLQCRYLNVRINRRDDRATYSSIKIWQTSVW